MVTSVGIRCKTGETQPGNRKAGGIIAFLAFSDIVQRICTVQILPGIRFLEGVEMDSHLTENSYATRGHALRELASAEQITG